LVRALLTYSYYYCALGIIKGMVGPAILYLPHGFASAGYVVALPIMLISTTLFLYSSACLLDAWKLESTKMNDTGEGDGLLYDATNGGGGGGGKMPNNNNNTKNNNGTTHHRRQASKQALRQMLSYPELAYRALGPRGESLVKAGIALMQSGVCLTYLIFVPQNLHTSVLTLSRGVFNIPPAYWLVLMVALQVPLSWIRDIRKLTPTNAVANALILYGLITCLFFALQAATTPETVVNAVVVAAESEPAAQDHMATATLGPLGELGKHLAALAPYNTDWFLFIGTSVLMFEGSITLLVPLQEAVHSEQEREAFPRVYRKVIMGIICFYAFFGMTCWMAFGHDVQTVLTTSLPANALATTVQLAYSVAVVFTFPCKTFPHWRLPLGPFPASWHPGKRLVGIFIHAAMLSVVSWSQCWRSSPS
jgi:proton-coupled amino acid transporter